MTTLVPSGARERSLRVTRPTSAAKPRLRTRRKPIPKKHAVVALVERDGQMRAKHVPTVSVKTLRDTLTQHADRKSHLMTDDSPASRPTRGTFKKHGVVVHSKGEYVKKDGITIRRPSKASSRS